MSTTRTASAPVPVEETATITPAGDFGIVSAAGVDISALRSRPQRDSKYPKLIKAVLAATKNGEAMEIKNTDGSELTEQQATRMYGGINNFKRYRKVNSDETIAVSVHRAGNRLFLINENEA
jgi:hypothetical protein